MECNDQEVFHIIVLVSYKTVSYEKVCIFMVNLGGVGIVLQFKYKLERYFVSNMGYDLLCRYVTIMGRVMVIVTVLYTWVSGVEKSLFGVLRNYWMIP